MSASKTAASSPSGKGAAARSRKKKEPKEIEFRGLKLILPPELPVTFGFDLAALQESGSGLHGLLISILGEDQYASVRAHLAEGSDSMDDFEGTLAELLNALSEPYGIAAGEAPASASS